MRPPARAWTPKAARWTWGTAWREALAMGYSQKDAREYADRVVANRTPRPKRAPCANRTP